MVEAPADEGAFAVTAWQETMFAPRDPPHFLAARVLGAAIEAVEQDDVPSAVTLLHVGKCEQVTSQVV